MAHVREVQRKKAPNGIAFEVHWRDGDRKMQRTFTVKREAERFALKVEDTKASGDITAPLAKNFKTFREVAADSFEASRSRLKAGTLVQYENLFDRKILPRFGARRISTITGQDVERWVADLTADGLAPNTVHNHYVLLNKVFRYAMRHRLIPFNPCDGVELPKNVPSEDFAPVFLTAKQVDGLAAQLEGYAPLDTLMRFAAYTGLRAAEIAGLRVQDVNFSAGHVQVRQTVKRLGGEWTVGTPKSKRSTRNVPLLNRELIAALKLHLLAHPNSGDPDALFWPGRSNGSRRLDWTRPIDLGGVLKYYMRPAAERAGISKSIRFHDLRHTCASLMFAAGFKPYEVSRWMGHASVATTDGIYAHLYPSDYNEQIARFEAFVAEG